MGRGKRQLAGATSRISRRLHALQPSLYARIYQRLAAYKGEIFPFHVGNTHLPPPPGVAEALAQNDDPALFRYSPPQGDPELRAELAQRLVERGHDHVHEGDVVITAGATHGLSLACQATLNAGDEVMVLSPHWPLITGMVQQAGAIPVEVSFTDQLGDRDGKAVEAILRAAKTDKTRALYVTYPNNPDGVVLKDAEREALARFAVENDLLVFCDEAYEAFHFCDIPTPMSTLPGMAERTINLFSFSKSHRIAGLRLGYAIAPPDVLEAMVRMVNFTIYNVPLLLQRAAVVALRQGQASVEVTRESAKRHAKILADALDGARDVDFVFPEGGAYLFLNLENRLGERDSTDLLDHCLQGGLVFSPGSGFGAQYGKWVRLCYTAMGPESLTRGADRFLELLDRFSGHG
jgi:aspartate/methionine/tyrosine aminotransferase